MRFEDLNWMDVEAYLRRDDRVILVTGATEQHAYLSLMTDVLIPSKLALAVAEQENVLVAPPLNFGLSSNFSTFPGTISLSRSTFDMVLTEVVQSLLYQGFGGFLILNGNIGNSLPDALADMHLDGYVRIVWHDWWQSPALNAFEAKYGQRSDHANWCENYPFTRVAETPKTPKPMVNLGYLETGDSLRDILQDGSYGGVYQMDDDLMQSLFNHLVAETVPLLKGLART